MTWLDQGHNGFTVEHALMSAGSIYDVRDLKKSERNEAVKVLERQGFTRKRRGPPEGGPRCLRYWKDCPVPTSPNELWDIWIHAGAVDLSHLSYVSLVL